MSDEDDRDAVWRVLRGDPEAFAGVVERWQRPLVSLAWRFCHDAGRAEDLAQESFLKAYQGLGAWRGTGRFSTWLFAIAVNVCRSAAKGRRDRTEPLDPDSAFAAVAPIDAAEEAERRDVLNRALLRLPGRYRDAVILYYFHEMNVAEAARTLGIPEGTLKARLHRGRALLRERLAASGVRP
jgi:RNA polymerase sigma-70 factor (ECF subfamily)